MALFKLNLDSVDTLEIECQKGATNTVEFTAEVDETISPDGCIKVAKTYNHPVFKTYSFGDGLTQNGQTIRWEFQTNDFNNENAVFDFSIIRRTENQRDLKGTLIVNPAL
jgi:hypothetical protein